MKGKANMCTAKKKFSRRISVWALVFAMILTAIASALIPVKAAPIDDAGRAVSEAVSDVGDGIGEAMSDVGGAMSDIVDGSDGVSDGAVSDSDGIIGNESDEAASTDDVKNEDGSTGAWLGIVIAIVIVAIVVVLIVILIPKKKGK